MRVSKKPEERRAELVAAARYLLDKKGVAHTRVSDIVGHVGVAQGVFYYYFSSKEEIVREVMRQVAAEMQHKADAILAREDADFCCKMSLFIELYIELIDQFLGDDETSLRGLDRTDAPHSAPAAQGQIVLENKLLELVAQGTREGSLAIDYPAETALVLLQGLRRLAEEKLPGRRLIYTIAEQGLGLGENALLQYLPPNTGKK